MHIRRGDEKVSEDPRNYSNQDCVDAIRNRSNLCLTQEISNSASMFIAAFNVQNSLDSQGLDTVYLATDDPDASAALASLLGDSLCMLHQPFADHSDRHYIENHEVLITLTDIVAFRKVASFVGSATSNFGQLVFLLMVLAKPYINLSELGVHYRRSFMNMNAP